MTRPRLLTIFGLLAVMAVCFSACGDDDDSSATGQADAPPATRAFGGLRQALEAQGLVVTELPKSSRDGAEEGVAISGAKTGSARVFSTEAEAKAYAGRASEQGDAKTLVVGTVVFQSTTQENAQFFADAYEGG